MLRWGRGGRYFWSGLIISPTTSVRELVLVLKYQRQKHLLKAKANVDDGTARKVANKRADIARRTPTSVLSIASIGQTIHDSRTEVLGWGKGCLQLTDNF